MEPWAERIKSRMTAAGMSQTALAKACGVAPPSVSAWWAGKTKMIGGDNLVRAAKALGVTCEWIMTGKSTIVSTVEPAESQAVGLTAEMIRHTITLLTFAAEMGRRQPPSSIDPDMFAMAYQVVRESDAEPTESNVIDFIRRLNQKIDAQGKNDGGDGRKASGSGG